ncbi:MAG: RidA family protein [Candidatus Eisenbacteria bacterium]|uniref:RidA family protein n=1 Tax=Eiseniibacteriota bacterium TaxID=2212470 RepID=A0A956LWT7_UNCEI|nr:RidA family protein [Candidatus Eisenbacteria bacterium]
MYQVINPESLGAPRGWNHGMLAPTGGRVLFIAGQVGSDETGRVISDDFVEQFGRALENVLTVVRQAGGDADSVGRLFILVTSVDAYLASLKPLGVAYRAIMGRHYPAMCLAGVSRLVDPRAQVEIEALAVIAPEPGS